MEINILKLIPRKWKTKNVSKNEIKIYYIIKGRGNSPNPISLPKKIKIDLKFIEALAMYLGDGKLSSDLNHLEFTTKDKDMAKLMLNFFTKYLEIPIKEVKFRLRFKNETKNMEKDWANCLKINYNLINSKKSKRYKEECLSMQIGSKILRILFEKIINEIVNSNFYKNTKIRRAFLRGLFAAEGGLAINKKQNYVVYLAYHFGIHEEKLTKLVSELLNLEEIKHKELIRKNKGERYLRITGWNNYWKAYKINLFDLNQRKKDKFLKKCKKTNFQCIVNKKFLDLLLNSKENHRKISLATGIHVSTICELNKGKREWISLKDLIKLIEFNNLEIKELRKNIIKTRVSNQTLIEDEKFKDFILKII